MVLVMTRYLARSSNSGNLAGHDDFFRTVGDHHDGLAGLNDDQLPGIGLIDD